MSLKYTSTRLFSVLFITTALSACTAKPREVVAERPLVENATILQSGQAISTTFWESLSKAGVTTLSHSQYVITLGKPYISALGNDCRQVTIQREGTRHTQVACTYYDAQSNTNQWRLMPALESGVEEIAL